MSIKKSIIIDFEALGSRETSIVLDLAAVVFSEDTLDDFNTLRNDSERLFHGKFSTIKQTGRTVDKDTLEWWNKQSDEVRVALSPASHDESISALLNRFNEFCERNEVDPKNSLIYSRGTSYDMPLMASISLEVDNFGRGRGMFPCAFWSQRDVRTAIAYAMLQPHLRVLPVEATRFDGFVKHNSIHDVCKDAILLQLALAYGRGTIEMPDIDAKDGSVIFL